MGEGAVHRRGEAKFEEILASFRRSLPGDVGGIGCFIGIVRGITGTGRNVRSLRYECAEDIASKLKAIADDAEKMPGIRRASIHHVIDELSPGDDTVYVLVAGRGRREVFRALEGIMERVKKEPLIWKKEVTQNGEYWVQE